MPGPGSLAAGDAVEGAYAAGGMEGAIRLIAGLRPEEMDDAMERLAELSGEDVDAICASHYAEPGIAEYADARNAWYVEGMEDALSSDSAHMPPDAIMRAVAAADLIADAPRDRRVSVGFADGVAEQFVMPHGDDAMSLDSIAGDGAWTPRHKAYLRLVYAVVRAMRVAPGSVACVSFSDVGGTSGSSLAIVQGDWVPAPAELCARASQAGRGEARLLCAGEPSSPMALAATWLAEAMHEAQSALHVTRWERAEVPGGVSFGAPPASVMRGRLADDAGGVRTLGSAFSLPNAMIVASAALDVLRCEGISRSAAQARSLCAAARLSAPGRLPSAVTGSYSMRELRHEARIEGVGRIADAGATDEQARAVDGFVNGISRYGAERMTIIVSTDGAPVTFRWPSDAGDGRRLAAMSALLGGYGSRMTVVMSLADGTTAVTAVDSGDGAWDGVPVGEFRGIERDDEGRRVLYFEYGT